MGGFSEVTGIHGLLTNLLEPAGLDLADLLGAVVKVLGSRQVGLPPAVGETDGRRRGTSREWFLGLVIEVLAQVTFYVW